MSRDLCLTGYIVRWTDRGFGFIRDEQAERDGRGEVDTFVHISELTRQPRVGQRLAFTVGLDARGRRKAVNVRALGGDS